MPHVPTRVFDFDRGATVFFDRIEDGGVVGGAGGGEAHDRARQGAIVGEVHVPEMFFDWRSGAGHRFVFFRVGNGSLFIRICEKMIKNDKKGWIFLEM